jgi:hypothetical protein
MRAVGEPKRGQLQTLIVRKAIEAPLRGYLRSEGGNFPDVHWGLFLLPMFESMAAQGIVVHGAPLQADRLPPHQPAALSDWCRALSDKAHLPAGTDRQLHLRQADSFKRELALIRAAVEDADVRTPYEYERYMGGNRPTAATPPPMFPTEGQRWNAIEDYRRRRIYREFACALFLLDRMPHCAGAAHVNTRGSWSGGRGGRDER